MSHEPKRADFSVPVRINLYSDTQTRPSRAMKEAMMAAEVGDEQGGSDPTVWELCDRSAALLGKEAAMFMPSGTMCNQVALATHCRPGDEILAHEDAHVQSSEAGGPGAISGVMIRGLPGERGIFSTDTLRLRSARCLVTRRRNDWSRSNRRRTKAAVPAGRLRT